MPHLAGHLRTSAIAAQSDTRPLGVTIAEGVTLAFVAEERVRDG
jgi:hypothetical protein